MEFVSRHLGRWPVALACVIALAAAVLLPGLGTFGLWEPQERQLADRVAPRAEVAAKQQATPPAPPPNAKKEQCERMAPKDPTAGGNPIPIDEAACLRLYTKALGGEI